MAKYNTEVRIHAEMDNKQAKKGAEEIEESLDRVGKKAEEKIDVGIQWDEKAQKDAEENIDRILKKKKELAEQEASPVVAETDEPQLADFDWQANAEYAKKIKSEIEAYTKTTGESAQEAQKASEHFNLLRAEVEEYAKDLKELEEQGQYFGDADYDRVYVAWKDADEAVRQYASDLNNQTEKGQAAEAAKTAKMAEQQAAEKELEDIRRDAIVTNQNLVSLMREREEITQRIAKLKRAGVTDGYEEYDSLQSCLSKINDEIRQQKDGFAAVEQSGRKACETISRGSKKAGGLLGKLKSRVTKLAVSLLVINQIRKGFQAMMSAAQEGLKNLASYSKDYNAQMSALKSSSAQLKNAFASAFEPIINRAIPYLVKFVDWMTKAADSAAQFLAALQGKSTYTKAKKQIIDYAKSLDTASKSAKRALASFDELNVLNASNTGTSNGGEATGADAFETATVSTRISAFATETLAALKPLQDVFDAWRQSIDFEPLLSSLGRLEEACEPFAGYLADGIVWFLENALLPLGTWTIEDALPEFIDMLGEGLDTLDVVLKELQPTFDYFTDNILQPIGEFTGQTAISGLQMLKDTFKDLADLFAEKGDSINLILTTIGKAIEAFWAFSVKPHIQFVMGGLKTLLKYVVKVAGDLIDILSSITNFIAGVFTADWNRAWDGITDYFKGVVNLLIDIVEGMVNTIIDALNSVSFDVPKWVPVIGGNHYGIDIDRLDIPRLADGAVIQGGRPFAAILGDQPSGQTNIETPLATMVEAFKIAQAETGGGGQYTFVAQLDGREIYREVVRRDQMHADKTGSSAFWT